MLQTKIHFFIAFLSMTFTISTTYGQYSRFEIVNRPHNSTILDIKSNNNGDIYVMTAHHIYRDEGSGLFKSQDRGLTFKEIKFPLDITDSHAYGPPYYFLYISDTVIFVEYNNENWPYKLYRSFNNGNSWDLISINGNTNLRFFSNAKTGPVIGIIDSSLYLSEDNGTIWKKINKKLGTNVSDVKIDEEQNIWWIESEIVKRLNYDDETIDSFSLKSINPNPKINKIENSFKKIFISNSDTIFNFDTEKLSLVGKIPIDEYTIYPNYNINLAMANDSTIIKAGELNPSSTYIRLSDTSQQIKVIPIGYDRGWRVENIPGDGVYSGSAFYGIYKSFDTSFNFIPLKNGLPDDYLSDISGSSNNTLFAGTKHSGLFMSQDSGVSWKKMIGEDYNFAVRSIYVFNSNHIICSSDTCAYQSFDKGSTWSKVSISNASNFSHDKNNKIYATTPEGIMTSINDGQSWDLMIGSPLNLSSISVSKDGDVYCAGGGIFYLHAGDTAWSNPMSHKHLNKIKINTGGQIVAGVSNNRFYQSLDRGLNWLELHVDIPNVLFGVCQIEVDQNDNFIVSGYLDGEDRGLGAIFRIENDSLVEMANNRELYSWGEAITADSWVDLLTTDSIGRTYAYCIYHEGLPGYLFRSKKTSNIQPIFSAPTLISPLNISLIKPDSLILKWECSNPGDYFKIELWQDDIKLSYFTTNTDIQINLPPGITIFKPVFWNVASAEYKSFFYDNFQYSDTYWFRADPPTEISTYYTDNSNIQLYPNPVIDKLNINFNTTGKVTVQIIDINGRIQYNNIFQSQNSAVDCIDLSRSKSGMYILRVCDQKSYKNIRFIKK